MDHSCRMKRTQLLANTLAYQQLVVVDGLALIRRPPNTFNNPPNNSIANLVVPVSSSPKHGKRKGPMMKGRPNMDRYTSNQIAVRHTTSFKAQKAYTSRKVNLIFTRGQTSESHAFVSIEVVIPQ